MTVTGEGRGPRRGPAARVVLAWCGAVLVAAAGLAAAGLALIHSPSGPGAARPNRASPAAGTAAAAAGAVTATAGRPASARGPASPPVRVCGNKKLLGGGPSSPPRGAVVIPAGDDSGTALGHTWTMRPRTIYWFAPGAHTLAQGQFSQIVPADGDTFVGAPGAVLDGQHSNLYAFTQDAKHVTIRYLTIQNFGKAGDNGGQGVVNHDEGAGWRIGHVTVRHSAGAGIMLGPRNILAYSCLKDNGEYGFQGGGPHITVNRDEVVGNNTDNWEARQPGCGCSGAAKFWGVDGAVIKDSYVHDNHGPGLWADTNNRGFDVEGNYIARNEGEGFIFETSYNLRLAHNTFLRNALAAGPHVGGFPDPAVYISESGADHRVAGPFGKTLDITHNTFTDNWSGVVLWENADRFCGSPANTSTGECTLVSPKLVTVHSCNAANISEEPYYDGCRWKTQNVLVSGNYFSFDPANIGPGCTPAKFCGFNGIFSQWGSEPSWSPYRGAVVENHITFSQGNHFAANTYHGPWRFVIHAQGNAVTWAAWRGKPYRQDAGSTMSSRGA
jgi:Right handed beta helix region